jgi:hypothetical protein
MFQFLGTAVQYIAPVFVLCTMLNVVGTRLKLDF